MIPKVAIGASTWAVIIAALGGAIAFVTQWAQSGSAPAWLAGLTAVLVAVLSVTRSLQATFGTPVPDPTEAPAPTDPPAAA